jgi:hypothetical protein
MAGKPHSVPRNHGSGNCREYLEPKEHDMTDTTDPGPRPRFADEAAQAAKSAASDAWRDAKHGVREEIEHSKDAAADGIERVADALHEGARRSHSDSDAVARLAGATADGLERVSQALRGNDIGAMLRGVESFSRRQPMAFFGIALATGFIAARAMKASND